MKPRKTNDIISVLKQKGFRQISTHHKYLHLYIEETATEIYTFIGHGIDEYGNDLLAKMKRQLGFKSHQQFNDFLNCPMSYNDYVKMLKESGKINLLK